MKQIVLACALFAAFCAQKTPCAEFIAAAKLAQTGAVIIPAIVIHQWPLFASL